MWVAHGTLPSADGGATYASLFVRNDDGGGVHPSWLLLLFEDALDPIIFVRYN